MASRELALNCLLFGDDPENSIFVVRMAMANKPLVADLKKAIKAEVPVGLAHVDAHNLRLWKVSIPFDAQLTQAVEQYTYEGPPLRAVKLLTGLFENPLEEHLHVLIRQPGDDQVCQPSVRGVHVRGRELEKQLLQQYISHAMKSPPPSSAAASKLKEIQEAPMGLLNGRPLQNHGLPIELYHPIFDEFSNALKESTPMEITHANYGDVAALCAHAAGIYITENDREKELYNHLETILGMLLGQEHAAGHNSPRADRVIALAKRAALAFLAFVETKNEIGSGHCDPAVQASFSYRTYWIQEISRYLVNSSNCPSFLIAIAGPHIRILGAVFTRSVIVKPLTDWIQLDIDPADDAKLERFARVLLALRASLESLKRYYEGLDMDKSGLNDARFFPHICSYPGADEAFVEFRYLEKLAEASFTKPVFKAQIGDEGPFIVVKFVQRYSSDAHRLLYGLGLAPKLLYSGFDKGNTHGNCGSLKMVVMEFVEGQTAYDIAKPLSVKQFDQVQTAVKTLHTEGFVFGDLRLPNIMLDGDIVKLIDFDWCEKEETGRYPITINNDIRWHADVRRGGPMAKEHDDFMLEEMPRLR